MTKIECTKAQIQPKIIKVVINCKRPIGIRIKSVTSVIFPPPKGSLLQTSSTKTAS